MEFGNSLMRKVSLAVSFAGIAMLLILVIAEEPLKISPAEIDESLLDRRVVSRGMVKERFFAKDALFFSLADGGSIKVVVFSPTVKELVETSENGLVNVRGRVKKYRGQLEIVAEEVKRIG